MALKQPWVRWLFCSNELLPLLRPLRVFYSMFLVVENFGKCRSICIIVKGFDTLTLVGLYIIIQRNNILLSQILQYCALARLSPSIHIPTYHVAIWISTVQSSISTEQLSRNYFNRSSTVCVQLMRQQTTDCINYNYTLRWREKSSKY